MPASRPLAFDFPCELRVLPILVTEGGLDLKCVQMRYKNGLEKVDDWSERCHKYVLSPRTLTELQPELMEHKRTHGPGGPCLGLELELCYCTMMDQGIRHNLFQLRMKPYRLDLVVTTLK